MIEHWNLNRPEILINVDRQVKPFTSPSARAFDKVLGPGSCLGFVSVDIPINDRFFQLENPKLASRPEEMNREPVFCLQLKFRLKAVTN